ncbi:unnamed protein product [Phytomonas sp. Hart1]|nr:unnamed protein product [Phytomonas sp. Hart1]|eukprot:CCW66929.1 unnamed protein product [Phytomonas sp. isolate Hart1]
MPVKIPKLMMGHLLHHLLRFGLVQREVHHAIRQYCYWLPDHFAHIKASKITIDLTVPLQECGFANIGFNYHAGYPLRAAQSSTNSALQKDPIAGDHGRRSCRSSSRASRAYSASLSEWQASPKSATPANSLNGSEKSANEHLFFMSKLRRVELCIIQILKKSRTMSHSELFECVGAKLQDRCSVPITLFKTGISNLIEKELMHNKGHDVYAYVA